MYKIACVTNRTEKVATIRRLQFPLLIVLRRRPSPPLSYSLSLFVGNAGAPFGTGTSFSRRKRARARGCRARAERPADLDWTGFTVTTTKWEIEWNKTHIKFQNSEIGIRNKWWRLNNIQELILKSVWLSQSVVIKDWVGKDRKGHVVKESRNDDGGAASLMSNPTARRP